MQCIDASSYRGPNVHALPRVLSHTADVGEPGHWPGRVPEEGVRIARPRDD